MYRYDEIDQRLVDERVAQFRDQTQRFLAGVLTEDQFRPLRLQNGLYLQRHAPMLRVAIPYGLLSARQLRMLAHIACRYDRGYGHFTTRQNVQFNWIELARCPDLLAELATVGMHAIQTSGNCVRNITTDHFAGIAPDEIVDSFVWCELIRQWSTFHPEFAYLPRKFKIAVCGARADRAASHLHDIGVHALRDATGAIGFRILVGGGMGRTPMIGQVLREFLPWPHLLTYLEAILRVYNRHGRRDNKHKARIKILVKALGVDAFRAEVEDEWRGLADGPATVVEEELHRIEARFTRPHYAVLPADDGGHRAALAASPAFAAWVKRNVHAHRQPGYAAVTLSLKAPGSAPGDASAVQMEAAAQLADDFSQGALRVTHEQNLLLADVRITDLHALWRRAREAGFATPTVGLIGNIVACPGGDFCSLANARSIPVAQAIAERFESLDYQHDIGELDLNISGCMNSCGHHHVGHIGILGVDKGGREWYQITIGGNQGLTRAGAPAAIGKVIGPSFAAGDVPDAIERLIAVYLERRETDTERFVDTVWRIGIEPFKERVYGTDHPATAHRRGSLLAAGA